MQSQDGFDFVAQNEAVGNGHLGTFRPSQRSAISARTLMGHQRPDQPLRR